MQSSGENTENKRAVTRARQRWENNIKTNPKDIWYQELSYIQMSYNKTQWRDLVNLSHK
jgi:hypothetical protein